MTDNGYRGAVMSSVQSPERQYEASLISAFDAAGIESMITTLAAVPYYGGSVAARDMALRRLFYLPGLEPPQSAVSAGQQRVITTPWILEGPQKTATYYHSMFHRANFGAGIDNLLMKFVLDYYTQDNGAFIEIIGPAPPLIRNGQVQYDATTGKVIPDASQPLSGLIQGIATLDALRCTRTGDPFYPVVYRDRENRPHKIHATRVWMAADMPSPDDRRFGSGFCALSRAVSVAQRLFSFGQMAGELMDNAPASGIMVVRKMAKVLFDAQMKAYETGRQMNEEEFYHGIITLFFSDKDGGVELVPFRQLWENFDDKKFYDIMIDLTAMCFNMDRQELAPLATSSLGSGAQSGQLAKKSRGKGIHAILSQLERFFNLITPQSITFHFDYTDEDQELQLAQIRQMKTNTILSMMTAKQPDSNVSIDNVGMTTPAINAPVAKGLITFEEARYLAVKENVLPRELLGEGQNMRPGWQRFDDVTVKAMRLYGPRIALDKRGRKLNALPWESWYGL
jgi:hypothetical protein